MAVAFGEAGEAQRQPAEAVVVVGVGAGQIDDEIGAGEVEGGVEAVVELQQVGIVVAAVWQFDVEIAGFLLEGKITGAVDGEGENTVVAAQDAGGAVALMDIAIDDQDALRPAFGQWAMDRPRLASRRVATSSCSRSTARCCDNAD